MKTIRNKILSWIFKRYFENRIITLTNDKIIPDIQLENLSSEQK